MKSEWPQRAQPTRPVGNEEADEYHSLQESGLPIAAIASGGRFIHLDFGRGCQP